MATVFLMAKEPPNPETKGMQHVAASLGSGRCQYGGISAVECAFGRSYWAGIRPGIDSASQQAKVTQVRSSVSQQQVWRYQANQVLLLECFGGRHAAW